MLGRALLAVAGCLLVACGTTSVNQVGAEGGASGAAGTSAGGAGGTGAPAGGSGGSSAGTSSGATGASGGASGAMSGSGGAGGGGTGGGGAAGSGGDGGAGASGPGGSAGAGGASGGSAGAAGGAAGSGCEPRTCEEVGIDVTAGECGSLPDDGCGAPLECLCAPPNDACSANTCVCKPRVCDDLDCGVISDDCGELLNCPYKCPNGWACADETHRCGAERAVDLTLDGEVVTTDYGTVTCAGATCAASDSGCRCCDPVMKCPEGSIADISCGVGTQGNFYIDSLTVTGAAQTVSFTCPGDSKSCSARVLVGGDDISVRCVVVGD